MSTRKLTKKIKFAGTLTLITGLRIGDSKESVEIGGVDAPVVRRKDNNQPYLPGSSIKGKLRCLLDLVHGKSDALQDGSLTCQLFGAADKKKDSTTIAGNQSRLIVRDAYLTPTSEKKLRESPFIDMPYTEIKAENAINRTTGVAENPRFFERVPAGAEFFVEFIINIFVDDDEAKLVQTFEHALALLDHDYLGGSGSRGYGQVKIVLQRQPDIDAAQFIVAAP
jgi:CRISPR-associated protein Csm3